MSPVSEHPPYSNTAQFSPPFSLSLLSIVKVHFWYLLQSSDGLPLWQQRVEDAFLFQREIASVQKNIQKGFSGFVEEELERADTEARTSTPPPPRSRIMCPVKQQMPFRSSWRNMMKSPRHQPLKLLRSQPNRAFMGHDRQVVLKLWLVSAWLKCFDVNTLLAIKLISRTCSNKTNRICTV